MAKRVAVVLAGCGVFDGSEIHEASAVLVHLSRNGASVSDFLLFQVTHPAHKAGDRLLHVVLARITQERLKKKKQVINK